MGVFLYGAAMMANYTNNAQVWVDRTTGLLSATDSFFTPFTNATNIMFEAACELQSVCNVDQLSMKAYLSRWMSASSIVAPYIAGRVGTLLRASALGAASACTSGTYGNSKHDASSSVISCPTNQIQPVAPSGTSMVSTISLASDSNSQL